MEEKMIGNERYAIIRRIDNEYQIEVMNQPGIKDHPTGFCYSIRELSRQMESLRGNGLKIIEDKEHPVHLEQRV